MSKVLWLVRRRPDWSGDLLLVWSHCYWTGDLLTNLRPSQLIQTPFFWSTGLIISQEASSFVTGPQPLYWYGDLVNATGLDPSKILRRSGYWSGGILTGDS